MTRGVFHDRYADAEPLLARAIEFQQGFGSDAKRIGRLTGSMSDARYLINPDGQADLAAALGENSSAISVRPA